MDEEVFIKMIDNRADLLAGHILNGRSADYPTYRALVGAYVELRALKDDLQHYLRSIDQDAVDDSQ